MPYAQYVDDGRDLTFGWCDDQSEFEFGLDFIPDGLDGLDRVSRDEGAQASGLLAP